MAQIRQKQKAFVSGVMLSLLTATVQAQGLDDHGDDHGGSLGAHVHGIASLNMALDGKFVELEFHTPAANVYGFEHAPRNEAQFTQVREAQRALQQADKLFVLTHAAGCRLGRVELEQSSEEGEHHEEHADHEHHEEKHTAHDEHAKHDDDHHDDHGHHEKHDDHHEAHASHETHEKHGHNAHHAHEEHAEHGHEKHEAHEKDEHDHAQHEKHADHDDHHKHEEHVHHAGKENGHSDLSVHYYYQCSAPEKLNSLEVGLFKAFPALEKLNLQLITPRVQQGKTLTARSYRVDF